MKDLSNLSTQQLNDLINRTDQVIKRKAYTAEQYTDALIRIQTYSYKDPQQCWGIRWRQKLSDAFPFIIKLLYRGYNNFLVMPISTHNTDWFLYSEEKMHKYAKYANVPAELYTKGWFYQRASRHWQHFNAFDTCIREDNNKRIGRYISYLAEVGAVAKVCDAHVDLENGILFSSKYIISKDKLRELVSLFIHTFSIATTTSSFSTSYISLHTYQLSLSSLGDMNDAAFRLILDFPNKSLYDDTIIGLINKNNELLPEVEQMRSNGRRIYSEVCNYLNEDKHEKVEVGEMTKQRYLDKEFGQNKWFEFDRRGSIYNLTYSLNKKEYIDNSIDIYEEMNGQKFASKEERELFKLTQMGVYFSTYRRQLQFIIRNLESKANGACIPEKTNKIIRAYWTLCGCNENTTWNEFVEKFRKYYTDRKNRMIKYIGDNKWLIDTNSKYSKNFVKNNEDFIFMHESIVYLKFVDKLRDKGLRVVQIYDGFYFEKGSISESELNNILKSVVMEYCKAF